MAAAVIHFGWDDCYRVPVLRSAGYEVRESQSLVQLRSELEHDGSVSAVVVSEDYDGTAEEAASIVHGTAPVILFRRSIRPIDESQFDRIFDCSVPPAVWLAETVKLIDKNCELQERARRLHGEVAKVLAESAKLQAESAELRAESVEQRAKLRKRWAGTHDWGAKKPDRS